MNTEHIQYWADFYSRFTVTDPSPFAHYVDNFLQTPQRILDVGCGNGRDSYFLAERGHYVEGIDMAIQPENKSRCLFRVGDMVACGKDAYTVVYSRFSFHSLTEKQQRAFLKSIPEFVFLFIETRSDKQEVATGTAATDVPYFHPTNILTLQSMLHAEGFAMVELYEGADVAPFQTENPICIRAVALKIPPEVQEPDSQLHFDIETPEQKETQNIETPTVHVDTPLQREEPEKEEKEPSPKSPKEELNIETPAPDTNGPASMHDLD